jgi:hypothetical protein
MIILIIIALAYCQETKNEFYSIRNVATSLYLSNIYSKSIVWEYLQQDIYTTIDKIKINSEWTFVLQNITYNSNHVYTIYNRFDNRCIDIDLQTYYEHPVHLHDCSQKEMSQYWIIEELGENRKRLNNYVEQLYITSYKPPPSSSLLSDLYIRENSIKAYQQWYIELI